MGHYEQVYRRDSVPRNEPPGPPHGMGQYDERAAVGYHREPIPRDTYMGGGPPVSHCTWLHYVAARRVELTDI